MRTKEKKRPTAHCVNVEIYYGRLIGFIVGKEKQNGVRPYVFCIDVRIGF